MPDVESAAQTAAGALRSPLERLKAVSIPSATTRAYDLRRALQPPSWWPPTSSWKVQYQLFLSHQFLGRCDAQQQADCPALQQPSLGNAWQLGHASNSDEIVTISEVGMLYLCREDRFRLAFHLLVKPRSKLPLPAQRAFCLLALFSFTFCKCLWVRRFIATDGYASSSK